MAYVSIFDLVRLHTYFSHSTRPFTRVKSFQDRVQSRTYFHGASDAVSIVSIKCVSDSKGIFIVQDDGHGVVHVRWLARLYKI